MPSKNNRDNIRKSKFTSNDVQELKLIQMNVEQTKKDVADISTYAQKEINTITNAIDKALSKLEALNKKSKGSYENMSQQEKKLWNQQMAYARSLNNERDKSLNKAKEEDKLLKEKAQKYLQYHDSRVAAENSKSAYQSQAIAQASRGNLSGAMNSMVSMRQSEQRFRIASGEANLRKLFENGTIGQERFESGMANFSKMTNRLDATAGKFQAAGIVFNSAVKVIKGFADTWLKRFKDGLNKVADTYEALYQKQAVLSGINEQQYQQAQKDMRDNIKQMGLQDNLAVTEVMNETSEYINRGITDFGKASQMGQQSAIGKVLAPYLDQQSDAYITLSQTLGPKFQKSMIGMSGFVSNQVGQNRFVLKNLDTIVDGMQYMTLAAKKDLMSGQDLAKIEQLTKSVEEGGAGMTMAQATQYYSDMQEVLTNRGKALQSGTLQQRVMAADMSVTDANSYNRASADYFRKIYGSTDTSTPWGQLQYDAIRNTTGDSGTGYNIDNNRLTSILETTYKPISAPTPEKTYEEKLVEFLDGQYTTALQEKDILAENLAVDLAIYKERWPDLYKVIREVGLGIIKDLGLWIGTKLMGKLFGKTGGGLLKSLFGSSGGKHAATLGSTITSNLSANGSWGATTGLGATVTAAGGIAGIAGGIYGVLEGNKDLERGKTGRGAASIAGGAAAITGGTMLAGGVAASSMLGVGVANAWNPVGWVVMAAGLAAVGITAIQRATDTSVDLSQELEAEKQAAVKRVKESNDKTIDQMYDVREAMKKSNSYEEAKQIALQNNIIKQEELDKATDKSIEGLLKLADVSIQDQKDLNDIGEQTAAAYEDIKNQQKEKAGNDILGLINTAKAGGRGYDDLSEDEKQKINSFMQEYIEANINSNDRDVKWRIKKWGSAFNDSTLSKDDFNKIMDGDNGTSSDLFESFVASDLGAKRLSENDNLSGYYGGYYSTLTPDQVNKIMQMALTSEKIEDAKRELEKLKRYNMPWDKLPKAAKSKLTTKFGDDVKSYAIGSNYIDNNQLAYLHEGEAVLTKAAANVLRNSTSHNVSTVYGVSDAIQNGSTLNKQGFSLIVSAINDQTVQLIAKMDQILAAVTSSKYTPKFNSKLVNLEGGVN